METTRKMNINKYFRSLLSVITLLVLVSCTENAKLKVEFENVAGLDERSPVLLSGLEVGNIENFEIQPDSKIIVEVNLNKEVTITKDAKFVISSLDILGGKGIIIENGTSAVPIDLKMVQQGQIEKPLLGDSTVVNFMDKVSSKLSTTSKLDSIENELKKLNKNIEKLNENN